MKYFECMVISAILLCKQYKNANLYFLSLLFAAACVVAEKADWNLQIDQKDGSWSHFKKSAENAKKGYSFETKDVASLHECAILCINKPECIKMTFSNGVCELLSRPPLWDGTYSG